MDFWRRNVDAILTLQGKDILDNKGHITNQHMEEVVKEIYERFNTKRKTYEAWLADEDDLRLLEEMAKYGKDNR